VINAKYLPPNLIDESLKTLSIALNGFGATGAGAVSLRQAAFNNITANIAVKTVVLFILTMTSLCITALLRNQYEKVVFFSPKARKSEKSERCRIYRARMAGWHCS
jgi:hypothetical protein